MFLITFPTFKLYLYRYVACLTTTAYVARLARMTSYCQVAKVE